MFSFSFSFEFLVIWNSLEICVNEEASDFLNVPPFPDVVVSPKAVETTEFNDYFILSPTQDEILAGSGPTASLRSKPLPKRLRSLLVAFKSDGFKYSNSRFIFCLLLQSRPLYAFLAKPLLVFYWVLEKPTDRYRLFY